MAIPEYRCCAIFLAAMHFCRRNGVEIFTSRLLWNQRICDQEECKLKHYDINGSLNRAVKVKQGWASNEIGAEKKSRIHL